MSRVNLKGNPFNTIGVLPKVGTVAPDFKLVKADLSEVTLANYSGKRKVLNIFPSIDTPTCALSVRAFNQKAAALKNTVVLCISADLPFAQKRFCGAEGISQLETLSTFRSDFGKVYQVEMVDSVLKGLCSRAVVVLDENNKVIYSEQVSEIAEEPNYEAALAVLNS